MSEVLRTIDFVCDGPPGPESGRFVEVEDQDGHGISLGEWIKRDDGYWVLRIPDPRDLSVAQAKLAALLEPGEYGGLLEMIEHEARIRPDSYLERLLRATATAIEQLQAQKRELEESTKVTMVMRLRNQYDEQVKRAEQADARLAEYKEDAERYRWLRLRGTLLLCNYNNVNDVVHMARPLFVPIDQFLTADDAIDAARRKEQT